MPTIEQLLYQTEKAATGGVPQKELFVKFGIFHRNLLC